MYLYTYIYIYLYTIYIYIYIYIYKQIYISIYTQPPLHPSHTHPFTQLATAPLFLRYFRQFPPPSRR